MLNILDYTCVSQVTVFAIFWRFSKKNPKKNQKTYLLKEIKLKSLTHHLFSLEEKHRFLMEIYCFSTWNYISWKILHNFLINHSTLIYIIYLHIFFFYIKTLFSQPRRKERAGQFKLCKNRYFFHSSKCILCIHYEAKKSCDRF